METTTFTYLGQNSSQRSVGMLLALAAAVVLSPLYVNRKTDTHYFDTRWNSSFLLPMVLGGLIIAIRTTSSTTPSSQREVRNPTFPSLDASSVFRFGSSSWGLAGVLIMLVLVLSWQDSVHEFFWR
ncbi:hypothetical protein IFM89_017230 [Coptis chinensis]|uniref:Uncharacterized protein n=1 Tax=Coptis chinensis TaxID=261450 RepID=A0A835HFD3_9MAGN|nr:hypothetical protein IFM89_017230 [Coptis chinensis]